MSLTIQPRRYFIGRGERPIPALTSGFVTHDFVDHTQEDPQLLPFEIDDLRKSVEAVPAGAPCGLDRETALRVLKQLKEIKVERDSLLAEIVEAGLG